MPPNLLRMGFASRTLHYELKACEVYNTGVYKLLYPMAQKCLAVLCARTCTKCSYSRAALKLSVQGEMCLKSVPNSDVKALSRRVREPGNFPRRSPASCMQAGNAAGKRPAAHAKLSIEIQYVVVPKTQHI